MPSTRLVLWPPTQSSHIWPIGGDAKFPLLLDALSWLSEVSSELSPMDTACMSEVVSFLDSVTV